MARWDGLWRNLHLATMAGDGLGVVEDGAIATVGERIAWIGPAAALPAGDAARTYDLGGAWVTPGLIDCHTHLVFGGDRAAEFELRLTGVPYAEIARRGGGIRSTVAATRAASDAELLASGRRRLEALRAGGVTTVEIKSGYGLDVATECRMLRIARRLGEDPGIDVVTSFLGAHALPAEFAHDRAAYLDLVTGPMLEAVVAERLADAVDGFGEGIAFTPAEIEQVFSAALRHGLPVKLHADQLSDQGGAALAARFKGLSADHLEHASAAGVAAMAAAGTVAVLLPGAFYTLKETTAPPVGLFRRHGVAMALATDANPGSSPLVSPLLALNMGCTLFGLTPTEALRGMTVHAATALGLGGDRGILEPGKRADLAIWRIGRPAELCYWLGQGLLEGLVKNGRPWPEPKESG
jgi:imidazolonepropionase